MARLTKETLFKPAQSRAESKWQTTEETVRAITEEETNRRIAKTERLRAARLAREAEERERTDSANGARRAPATKRRKN